MPTTLSKTAQEQARAEYLADESMSVERLAYLYGVPRTTMLRYLRGITRRKGGQYVTSVPTAEMRRMRDEGLTFREIGERVGLSTAGVQYRLRETGERETA